MRLVIESLNVFVRIGVSEEERLKRQRLIVDSQVDYEYAHRGDYLDYVGIVRLMAAILDEKPHVILEDVISDICSAIMDRYASVTSIHLSIRKPDVLPNCIVGVSHTASRDRGP